jgi:hypothetical protein
MTDCIRSPNISIRVVWVDLPDLVELETRVTYGTWSGVARAYTVPDILRDAACKLAEWSRRPTIEFTLEAGADTGIGWLCLRWHPIDRAFHIVCHVQMATSRVTSARPQSVWRLSLEIRTEAGLVERFARHLASVAETLNGEAVLEGVDDVGNHWLAT